MMDFDQGDIHGPECIKSRGFSAYERSGLVLPHRSPAIRPPVHGGTFSTPGNQSVRIEGAGCRESGFFTMLESL